MAKIRVKGDTSGYIDIAAPDVAGAATVNLDKIPQTDQTVNFTNNVGIGVASPTQKLHVESAGANYILTRDSTSGGVAGIIMQNGSDTRGIRINNATTEIYDHSAGVARVLVDASGRVTMPYQPMFRAALQNTQTSAGTVVFNSIRYQVGNHYNNSTGFFTAPVAGRYQFNLVWLTENNANEGNAELRKNNADVIFRTRCGRSSGHKTTTGTAVVDMVANDTASIYFDGGGSQFYGDANLFWTVFSGYLIG